MLRKVASKVAWVGRTASMVFGLALVLALLFGVASMALAGTGVGATFNLGHVNSVNKISSLIGSASSAMLKIDNNGSGPALALRVEPGEQPMTVNSARKVARLNADTLDGKDSAAFLPADTYMRQTSFTARAGLWDSAEARCDERDLMIGGGYSGVATSTHVASSTAFISQTGDGSRFWGTWSMLTRNTATVDDAITVRVICADSP